MWQVGKWEAWHTLRTFGQRDADGRDPFLLVFPSSLPCVLHTVQAGVQAGRRWLRCGCAQDERRGAEARQALTKQAVVRVQAVRVPRTRCGEAECWLLWPFWVAWVDVVEEVPSVGRLIMWGTYAVLQLCRGFDMCSQFQVTLLSLSLSRFCIADVAFTYIPQCGHTTACYDQLRSKHASSLNCTATQPRHSNLTRVLQAVPTRCAMPAARA